MDSIESFLGPAHELAYFVHQNVDAAVAIVGAAVAQVPRTTILERKRMTYAPAS